MTVVEEMEKVAMARCSEMYEMQKVINALSHFGYKLTDTNGNRTRFFEGLGLINQVIGNQYMMEIANCFILVGVGGEEVKKMAIEKAREKFGEHFEDIQKFADAFIR